MTGRALLLIAPRQLRWVEEVLPPIGPNDLLVETRVGAVSLGAELPQYRGDARSSAPLSYPRMTGYESLGIVLARGAMVREVQVGQRVVACYGHRTHAVIPANRVIVVPRDVSDELALLVILSGDVATGVRKLGPILHEPILVTGAGAIGLLAVFVLAALGASAVDVIEPQPDRRAKAVRLGARTAVAPQDVTVLSEAYAGGIECSSRTVAFAVLQQRLQHGGRICVLADGNIEPLTLTPVFHERELTVIGSSDCRDYASHAQWYFPIVRGSGHELAQLFDKRILAAELADAFARLADRGLTATKVLVLYGDT